MNNTFLSKLLAKTDIDIIDSDQKHFLYVGSKWLENSLELHVHANYTNKTYKGQVSAEEFAQYANELDVSVSEFYDNCKEALSGSTLPQTYEYELVEEELLFFRLIKKHELAFVYLQVTLKLIGNNCIMLDNAVNLISDLREAKISESEMARKDDKISEELLLQLDHCIEEKDKMERKLLRKFLVLLNTKKKKINELKELLSHNGINDSDNLQENDQNASTDQNRNDDDDDDFNAETQALSEDDYMEAETSARIRKKRLMKIGSEDDSE